MKLAVSNSVYWHNNHAEPMRIEADVSRGLFIFHIVGLADKSVHESRLRILSALKHTGFYLPQRSNHKVTVSLLPSDIRKAAIHSDLAIAAAYLAASDQIHIPNLPHIICIGELGLDGSVFTTHNIAPILYAMAQSGYDTFLIPHSSVEHASLVPNINICGIGNLATLASPLIFKRTPSDTDESYPVPADNLPQSFDIDRIKGLQTQKRMLAIAVAGNHHIFMSGPPGSGKSALMRCAGEITDRMTRREALDCTGIRAGSSTLEMFDRRIRQPHHTISEAGVVGGGALHKMGEIPLSHHGILMLDELCEFKRPTLESMREFMESGKLSIHKNNVNYSSQIRTLVMATSNLCPCGNSAPAKQSVSTITACKCTYAEKTRYQKRISEALIDRFQIRCTFNYCDSGEETAIESAVSGQELRQTVSAARAMQRNRNPQSTYNGELASDTILSLGITADGMHQFRSIASALHTSNRTARNTLRVARTIADLEQSSQIDAKHLLEAIRYTKSHPFA